MTDQRQTPGTRRASRRIVGGAMTVGLAAVVFMAFGASAASARPSPLNPPTPTGTITVGAGGAVTVNLTGTWTWTVGTQPGDIKAKAGSASKECAGKYGVGWGIVWNDPNDPGYSLKYGKIPAQLVGSTSAVNGNAQDEGVHVSSSLPCGTFSAAALTGPWTDSHIYANAASVPSSICVVNYVLKTAKAGHPSEYKVDKNKRNSFHTAVSKGQGAAWPTSSACFDPSVLRSSPTIVTTATNAQVGSPITDTAALSGTTHNVTPVGAQAVVLGGNAGGTITFTLYGPGDTTCSTPIYTSPPVTVNGNGTYGPTSFTPTQGAGTYRWVATYSGDVTNNGATEACGATGETSTVTVAPVTAATSTPTSTSTTTPVVATATTPAPTTSTGSTTSSTPAAISGATTVHTGEPWAGSKPYVAAVMAFGLCLMGLGFFERRRTAIRTHAADNALSTD